MIKRTVKPKLNKVGLSEINKRNYYVTLTKGGQVCGFEKEF